MKHQRLSKYFIGIAAKRLSQVEVDPGVSNQHEFNGVTGLQRILGPCGERRKIPGRFLYLTDDSDPQVMDASFTWYESRRPPRHECRLYYQSAFVRDFAASGDLLVLGSMRDGTLMALIAPRGSTIERQIAWLFALDGVAESGGFLFRTAELDDTPLLLASKLILQSLGMEPVEFADEHLDHMLERFGREFPSTRIFSEFARGVARDVSPIEDPDGTLVTWYETEDALFRTFERHLLSDRLHEGFENDIDGFVQFSLSVLNRRKARAGNALEHHVEALLTANHIRYSARAKTEGNSRPDFLFPDVSLYSDLKYPDHELTMLGVKSTCKDRWRQVLAEANRIGQKHLLTLEPGISPNQTDEMKARHLQLVLPSSLHETYLDQQRVDLLTVRDFLSVVRSRQAV